MKHPGLVGWKPSTHCPILATPPHLLPFLSPFTAVSFPAKVIGDYRVGVVAEFVGGKVFPIKVRFLPETER